MGGNKRKSDTKGDNSSPPSNTEDLQARMTRLSAAKSKNIKFDELTFPSQRSTNKSPKKKKQKISKNESDEELAQEVNNQNTQDTIIGINNNAISDNSRSTPQLNQMNKASDLLLDLENGRRLSNLNTMTEIIPNVNKKGVSVSKQLPVEIQVEVDADETMNNASSSEEDEEDEEEAAIRKEKRLPANQIIDRPVEKADVRVVKKSKTQTVPETVMASNNWAQGMKQMETMANFFKELNENSQMMNFMGQMAQFSKAFSGASCSNANNQDVQETETDNNKKETAVQKKGKAISPYSSPSVDTIYVPALNKKYSPARNNLDNTPLSKVVENLPSSVEIRQDPSEKIVTDYLNKIRIAEQTKQKQPTVRSEVRKPETNRGMEISEKAIVEAEKFKAVVDAPKGNENITLHQFGKVPQVSHDINNIDSRYCTSTSHIDETMKQKIETGQFLEIVKLAPKSMAFRGTELNNEKKLDIVSRDGHSFLVQTDNKETKIRNVRKWEECFRIYASIYAEANPHRGAEIWRYVDTINEAASNFHWDNVAHYCCDI